MTPFNFSTDIPTYLTFLDQISLHVRKWLTFSIHSCANNFCDITSGKNSHHPNKGAYKMPLNFKALYKRDQFSLLQFLEPCSRYLHINQWDKLHVTQDQAHMISRCSWPSSVISAEQTIIGKLSIMALWAEVGNQHFHGIWDFWAENFALEFHT